MKKTFATIPEAVREVKHGKMLIIVDSPKRENEGDLFIAADAATPAALGTMIRRGGGVICTAITETQARRLRIPLMVPLGENAEKTGVNFTISVSAKRGITTGVSAHDRAKTARTLADPNSCGSDLVRPGHVLGLVARQGGVLERQGQTEAAVDLARLAGRAPAGVLCEIVGRSGRMAKRAELFALARELGVKVVLVQDLVKYLKAQPLPPLPRAPDVIRVASATLPTKLGKFRIVAYRSIPDGREHAALVFGKPLPGTLVRVHSSCLTGDTLFSQRCDCGEQLKASMRAVEKEGAGIIVYLNQEGRGIGLGNKIRAYALQDRGRDTVEANHELGLPIDSRSYEAAADILKDQGVREVRLLTNNPEKVKQLCDFGIVVKERLPIESVPNKVNTRYLRTKKRKMGHRLTRV